MVTWPSGMRPHFLRRRKLGCRFKSRRGYFQCFFFSFLFFVSLIIFLPFCLFPFILTTHLFYAWFSFTCNHAPQGTSLEICNFFLPWRSIPHPRVRSNRQFPTPEILVYFIYVYWLFFFDPYTVNPNVVLANRTWQL